MNATEKKLAAIITSISAYIQTEEEALILPTPEKLSPRKFDQGNLWSISGRQNIMQTRNMVQMKVFNR